MSVDKLVDSTQLDSDLTSVANAIRAKSGGSSQLAFPAGFVSEIGNIPSGGGSEASSNFITTNYAFVTVGANNANTCVKCWEYLAGLANVPSGVVCFSASLADNTPYATDTFIAIDPTVMNGSGPSYFYRYRNGAVQRASYSTNYNAYLVTGSKYLVTWLEWSAPT